MASTSEYKTANLDVEENVQRATSDGLQNAGHHRPSGLEVRTCWSRPPIISGLTKHPAIYQSSICSQFWSHHPRLVGILRGDLSIRLDEWRSCVNILWLTASWVRCMRSRLVFGRTGLDVSKVLLTPII
jgi:hypothetical protein